MANFKQCFQCKALAPTLDVDRVEETSEDDGEETVVYTRESISTIQSQIAIAEPSSFSTFPPPPPLSPFFLLWYSDTCSQCKHVIAEHSYSFNVVDGYQV